MVYSEWVEARKSLDEKFREDTIELIKTQMELFRSYRLVMQLYFLKTGIKLMGAI